MTRYLALLRGVNVGGKAMLKMADLQAALMEAGFQNVKTYIQSGNVLFESTSSDMTQLAKDVSAAIQSRFKLDVETVVFSKAEWQAVIKAAPDWWGVQDGWRHNIMALLEPYDISIAERLIEKLKPEVEQMSIGKGVLYQSNDRAVSGRGNIAALLKTPLYKRVTIRNYNTAIKLLKLLED